VHIRVVLVKLNDSAKYVELSVECLRTRVRFPPSPPTNKEKGIQAKAWIPFSLLIAKITRHTYTHKIAFVYNYTLGLGGAMNSSKLIRMLEEDGWKLVRIKGSHHHFKHAQKPGLVTVPHPKRTCQWECGTAY
jgi:predicted RNA binding protein YcfA (HicA-like mRNA interferase family)